MKILISIDTRHTIRQLHIKSGPDLWEFYVDPAQPDQLLYMQYIERSTWITFVSGGEGDLPLLC